jgi:hypothetical protein
MTNTTLTNLRPKIEALNPAAYLSPAENSDQMVAYSYQALYHLAQEVGLCPDHDKNFALIDDTVIGRPCISLQLESLDGCPCRDSQGRKCGQKGYIKVPLLSREWLETCEGNKN